MRALKDKELQVLEKDVRKCFEGAAESTGCKLKITEIMRYKGTSPHPSEHRGNLTFRSEQ
jgi:metal-dependent amidase/aminoacylase/carboxypeptidase family protein